LYFQESGNILPASSTGKPKPASSQNLLANSHNSHTPVDLLSGKTH